MSEETRIVKADKKVGRILEGQIKNLEREYKIVEEKLKRITSSLEGHDEKLYALQTTRTSLIESIFKTIDEAISSFEKKEEYSETLKCSSN